MIYGREGMMALLLGVFLDLLIGDPHCFYHPIRLVGNLISVTEKGLRAVFPKTEQGEKTAGVFLSVIVCSVTAGAVAAVLYLAGKIHPYLHLAVMALFCYWMLAAKSLKDESMKVYRELKKEDLKAARRAVSMIVGRDTDQLTAEGVTKAAVETVAENASDGVMAPLLYLAVGGPVLGAFYKAVNTMDSMVGYKNEKYLYFGRFAAKVDDVLNYIPARLSALFMVAAAGLTGLSAKNAWKIFKRDRYNHASPNSAQTEAAMAGALGVQLAGDAWYFGTLYKKKTIGDALRPVECEDIRRANRLMYASAGLLLIVVMLLYCSFNVLTLL